MYKIKHVLIALKKVVILCVKSKVNVICALFCFFSVDSKAAWWKTRTLEEVTEVDR